MAQGSWLGMKRACPAGAWAQTRAWTWAHPGAQGRAQGLHQLYAMIHRERIDKYQVSKINELLYQVSSYAWSGDGWGGVVGA